MANTEALGGAAILPAKFNELVVGDTAPGSPVAGDLWIDTGPPVSPLLKLRGTSAYSHMFPNAHMKRLAHRNAIVSISVTPANQSLVALTGLSVPTTSQLFGRMVVKGNHKIGLAINGTTVASTAVALNHYASATPVQGGDTIDFFIGRRDAGTVQGWFEGNRSTIVGTQAHVIRIGLTAAIPSAIITSLSLLGDANGAPAYLIDFDLWELF